MRSVLIISFFVIAARSAAANNFFDSLKTAKEVKEILRKQIMSEAAWAMRQQPVTVTAEHSPRSAGGIHDFYSEGDYWWPNPVSIDSPYIQKRRTNKSRQLYGTSPGNDPFQ